MNANELANLLEVDSWYKLVTREEIATMLRQQQSEIEALKNFKEFAVGKYVLRFYKTDHVWTCTMTENMLDSVLKVANPVVEDWNGPILLGDDQ